MKQNGWLHQTIIAVMVVVGVALTLLAVNKASETAIAALTDPPDKQSEFTRLYMSLGDLKSEDKVFDITDPVTGSRYILIHKGKLVVEGDIDN